VHRVLEAGAGAKSGLTERPVRGEDQVLELVGDRGTMRSPDRSRANRGRGDLAGIWRIVGGG